MSKEIKSEVFEEDWNKMPMFVIYPVDEDGEKVDGEKTKNLAKFGIKKAKAILKHVEELEKFVEENS